jgi:hypothetical protein
LYLRNGFHTDASVLAGKRIDTVDEYWYGRTTVERSHVFITSTGWGVIFGTRTVLFLNEQAGMYCKEHGQYFEMARTDDRNSVVLSLLVLNELSSDSFLAWPAWHAPKCE